MSKLNYFSFSLILLFLGLSFFVIFSEPHNFKDIKIIAEESKIKDVTIKLEDSQEVKNYVLNWHESVSSDLNNYRKNDKISEDQYIQVNELIQQSLREYRDYTYDVTSNNYESANRSLYFSLWYVVRAMTLTQHYPVQNCITNSLITVNKYKPFFFFLKKEDRDTAINLKKESNRFNNYIEYSNRGPDSIAKIISEVRAYWNIRNDYTEAERICNKFKSYIVQDYEYQKFLFKVKVIIVLIFTIIIFIAGKLVTLKRLGSIFKSLLKGVSDYGEGIRSGFAPREVSKETIESILKLSSLTTAMATLGGLMFTVLGFKSWVIIVTTILCVVSLLSSILFGIISINNKSKKHRRGAYFLFLFGLIIFIILVLELIILVGISSIATSFKQSISTFLTNSTKI